MIAALSNFDALALCVDLWIFSSLIMHLSNEMCLGGVGMSHYITSFLMSFNEILIVLTRTNGPPSSFSSLWLVF